MGIGASIQNRSQTLPILICTLVAIVAWVGLRSALPLPGVAGLIDARSNKTRHDYSLVLTVRDAGAYGHALMTWAVHRSDSDRSFTSFGYYAEKFGGLIEVFDTAGTIKDELSFSPTPDQETRLALVFWLDEEQYQDTIARVVRWRGTTRYQLFNRDCVTFVTDIIEPLHLKTPSRLLFLTPYQFVVSLLEANAQREPQ